MEFDWISNALSQITMEFEEAFWIWEGVGNVSHLKTKGVGKGEESSCIFKVGRRPLHIFGAGFIFIFVIIR